MKKSILPDKEPVLNRSGEVVPVSDCYLRGNEAKYLLECVKTGWVSCLGPFVEKFERAFSSYCGARYGITCSSGTAALHLALMSVGVTCGDEVIIPSFTMVSTANAVAYMGAKPVLVDATKDTFALDPEKIEAKITKKTKAIIAVHLYGHPADMDPILKIARKHKLAVIEDAAEAHGAEYKGKRVGSIGDVACFSFYGNKIITTGEGGMVVTSNKKIKEQAEYMRDMAFCNVRHFWHRNLGFNYRMSNLQAAVGLAQVEQIDFLIERRRAIAATYNRYLRNVRGLTLPQEKPFAKNVYWMYTILIEAEFGMTRDMLRKKLAEHGIETRVLFVPIHLQPIYAKQCQGAFPVAEDLCRKGMYLPSGNTLTSQKIKRVCDCIKRQVNAFCFIVFAFFKIGLLLEEIVCFEGALVICA
ncbi:MAG: DegT/DnrJ/EryC1/StrS family aminotransferase [Candidatus Omnitrophica bacterium]|nr:DegT/DnrJ/EryC1/StrS family aminotransferase [Candidatus Omnitrophota bacterium]